MKNIDVKIINYVMQNCEMGIEALRSLKECVKDESMLDEIEFELNKYGEIYDRASAVNEQLHGERTPIEFMQKFMSEIGVKMNLLMGKSASHVAEMLIQGTNMGIIELNKLINENKDYENQEIMSLVKDLLKFEEDRLNKLKAYL